MDERKKTKRSRHRPAGLEILYEDDDLIVVDKTAGLLTEATRKGEARTAENILDDYVRKGCRRSSRRVWLVHRLDRDTSGVLLFAKSEEARDILRENWPGVVKIYLAAVWGHLREPSGVLTGYLYEDDAFFVHQTRDERGGKFARTDYEALSERNGMTLVRVRLHTGRKNQIRVQFAAIGHPVVGDGKYGRHARPFRERLCLHAKSISFPHPRTGERLFFETPSPGVFDRLFPGGV